MKSSHKVINSSSNPDMLKIIIEIDGITINDYSIKEIFCRQNQQPYIGIGATGCGKSFMATDILNSCMCDNYNMPFYFTSTIESEENTYIRENIPKFIVHDFDTSIIHNSYEYCKFIIKKIGNINDKQSIKNIISKYNLINDQENIYREFIKNKYLNKKLEVLRNYNITDIIIGINERTSSYIKYYYEKEELDKIIKLILNYDINNLVLEKRANIFKKIYYILYNLDNEMENILYNFDKLIIFKNIDKIKQIDGSISDDLKNINDYIPDKPKPVMIFDDVSSNLSSINTNSKTNKYKNYETNDEFIEKEKNIISKSILDILNTGRHFGLYIFLVHTMDIFSPEHRKAIKNLIILDNNIDVITKFRGTNIISKDDIPILEALSLELKKVNMNFKTFYKIIYFADNNGPNNCKYCIFKARTYKQNDYAKIKFNYNLSIKKVLESLNEMGTYINDSIEELENIDSFNISEIHTNENVNDKVPVTTSIQKVKPMEEKIIKYDNEKLLNEELNKILSKEDPTYKQFSIDKEEVVNVVNIVDTNINNSIPENYLESILSNNSWGDEEEKSIIKTNDNTTIDELGELPTLLK